MRMVISLQIPVTFWIGGSTFLLLNVHWVRDVKQIEIHIDELLVPDPSSLRKKLPLQI
jgi:hypothetical protein